MSSIINIQPVDITKTITQIQIDSVQVDLFNSATFNVYLKSADDRVVLSKTINMPKAVYDNWNNDDSFVSQYILQQLGFSPLQ